VNAIITHTLERTVNHTLLLLLLLLTVVVIDSN